MSSSLLDAIGCGCAASTTEASTTMSRGWDEDGKTFEEIMAAEEVLALKRESPNDVFMIKKKKSALHGDQASETSEFVDESALRKDSHESEASEFVDVSALRKYSHESETSEFVELSSLRKESHGVDEPSSELVDVQKEMLATMRSQLEVEREKNRVLYDKLRRRENIIDDEVVSKRKTAEPMLRALFSEYADDNLLSRRRWMTACEEVGLRHFTGRAELDLAFSRQSKKRHSLNYEQFLQALDSVVSRGEKTTTLTCCLGYLESFLGSPESERLKARAAAVLLDQPKLLGKCGPDMLRAACATLATTIAAECDLLAHPHVIATVDENLGFLESLFRNYASTHLLSFASCAALLADCWIVPSLVPHHSARRLAAVLVARENARNDDHFQHTTLPGVLLEKDERGGSLTFFLFVELLGHIALRTMSGKTAQARVRALLVDWLHRTKKIGGVSRRQFY